MTTAMQTFRRQDLNFAGSHEQRGVLARSRLEKEDLTSSFMSVLQPERQRTLPCYEKEVMSVDHPGDRVSLR